MTPANIEEQQQTTNLPWKNVFESNEMNRGSRIWMRDDEGCMIQRERSNSSRNIIIPNDYNSTIFYNDSPTHRRFLNGHVRRASDEVAGSSSARSSSGYRASSASSSKRSKSVVNVNNEPPPCSLIQSLRQAQNRRGSQSSGPIQGSCSNVVVRQSLNRRDSVQRQDSVRSGGTISNSGTVTEGGTTTTASSQTITTNRSTSTNSSTTGNATTRCNQGQMEQSYCGSSSRRRPSLAASGRSSQRDSEESPNWSGQREKYQCSSSSSSGNNNNNNNPNDKQTTGSKESTFEGGEDQMLPDNTNAPETSSQRQCIPSTSVIEHRKPQRPSPTALQRKDSFAKLTLRKLKRNMSFNKGNKDSNPMGNSNGTGCEGLTSLSRRSSSSSNLSISDGVNTNEDLGITSRISSKKGEYIHGTKPYYSVIIQS